MPIQQLLKEGTPKRELATALHQRLIELHKALQVDAKRTLDSWREGIYRQEFRPSAENLALYLALRNIDLTAEQQALSVLGLSSLGRSESHVLATLSAVTSLLEAAILTGDLRTRRLMIAFPYPANELSKNGTKSSAWTPEATQHEYK